MNRQEMPVLKEPAGRIMGKISRKMLSNIQQNLSHLTIKRSFYPLLLIENTKGKLSQNDLAQHLGCDKVQVVRIVNYLSSHGYVKRMRDTEDKRRYNLVVTDKANQVIPEIKRAMKNTATIAFRNIPQNKADELYVLLETIYTNLSSIKEE
ncbi:MAG: MarR family transcriptional regulator [Bacteroidales bacterium]|nr:MarR family transcriptional regulator [Bacteroidales bacterium]